MGDVEKIVEGVKIPEDDDDVEGKEEVGEEGSKDIENDFKSQQQKAKENLIKSATHTSGGSLEKLNTPGSAVHETMLTEIDDKPEDDDKSNTKTSSKKHFDDDDDNQIFEPLDMDDRANFTVDLAAANYADDDDDDDELLRDPTETIAKKFDDEIPLENKKVKTAVKNIIPKHPKLDMTSKGVKKIETNKTLFNVDLTEVDDGNSTVETRGKLFCNGRERDSEVIYWKHVPGDLHYESPITPHHADHHDRYITFEYDNGGWNNVRMSLECIIVIAHAMGRTLVIPPQQHLYLLGKTHKDEEDTKAHDEMGFSDFFDIDLLESHKGFHTISMKQFLTQEACQGGLGNEATGTKGLLPAKNNSDLWGQELWWYPC